MLWISWGSIIKKPGGWVFDSRFSYKADLVRNGFKEFISARNQAKPLHCKDRHKDRVRVGFFDLIISGQIHFFYIIQTNHSGSLTFSWRRSLSSRNQSNDLHSKSGGWFLYNRSLSHERVKAFFAAIKSVFRFFKWKKKICSLTLILFVWKKISRNKNILRTYLKWKKC